MTFRPDHDLHKRRFSRNVGLGVVLLAFVALVFALTIVKVSEGAAPPHAGDHAQSGVAGEAPAPAPAPVYALRAGAGASVCAVVRSTRSTGPPCATH